MTLIVTSCDPDTLHIALELSPFSLLQVSDERIIAPVPIVSRRRMLEEFECRNYSDETTRGYMHVRNPGPTLVRKTRKSKPERCPGPSLCNRPGGSASFRVFL